jgi:hypothetical protein
MALDARYVRWQGPNGMWQGPDDVWKRTGRDNQGNTASFKDVHKSTRYRVADVLAAEVVPADVAFGHVMLVSGRPISPPVRAGLEEEIRRVVSDKLDPVAGVAVQSFQVQQLGDAGYACFGLGVFASHGRVAQGDIRLAPADNRNDLRVLSLPNQQPAAWYRGQSGVAFSDDVGATPASISFHLGPRLAGRSFFFGRESDLAHPHLRLLEDVQLGLQPDPAVPFDIWPDQGRVRIVDQDLATCFYLQCRWDRSRFGFRAFPPDGPHLEVLAVVGPRPGSWPNIKSMLRGATVLHRWWIDFADTGHLAVCDLLPRNRAVVFSFGEPYGYDYSDPGMIVELGMDSSFTVGHENTQIRRPARVIEVFEVPDGVVESSVFGRLIGVHRTDRSPLGYLSLAIQRENGSYDCPFREPAGLPVSAKPEPEGLALSLGWVDNAAPLEGVRLPLGLGRRLVDGLASAFNAREHWTLRLAKGDGGERIESRCDTPDKKHGMFKPVGDVFRLGPVLVRYSVGV